MIKKLQALKAKKGFTLVELIVVIAIIGVLAAILVPTMLGMVTKSRVTSANSTAKSFKDQIDTFLTNADTVGYGMKTSSSTLQQLDITVSTSDGTVTWACTAADADNFKSGNGTSIKWGADASVKAGASKSGVTSAEALLCLTLADYFPDLKSASIHVSLRGNANCVALAYTADTSDTLKAMAAAPDVNTSGSYPILNKDTGEFESCAWDGKTAGVSGDGYIVGTAPEVPLS